MSKSKMNLPNKLTVGRIIMVPFVMALIMLPLPDMISRICGAALFALVSLTDMLDGKIARKYNLITDFGKFLDPLADKILVIATLLALMARYEYLAVPLAIVTAVTVLRELAVTSIRLFAVKADGVVIAASWLGKCKTVSQMAGIIIMLLEPLILPFAPFNDLHVLSMIFAAAMTVMTLWSGVDYIRAYGKYLDPTK